MLLNLDSFQSHRSDYVSYLLLLLAFVLLAGSCHCVNTCGIQEGAVVYLSECFAYIIIAANAKQKLVVVCAGSAFLRPLRDLVFVAEVMTCNSDLHIELQMPPDNITGIF